jgi:hypothetical protein
MTRTANSGGNVHRLELVNRNQAYRFSEQDPAMVELCSLIDASELSITEIVRRVSRASGGAYNIGSSTIYNWLNGKTKRPQSYTMNWAGFALGYERKWTKMR